jgi:DNA-binding response OmpR family regulator
MNTTVLFVDNNADFLELWAIKLRSAGYTVYEALSLEAAEQILARHWVHAMVVDVRMIDDDNPDDVSGLALVRNEAYATVPAVVFTSATDAIPAQETLRLSNRRAAKVDYILKLGKPDHIMHELQRFFANQVHIDASLRIHWITPGSFLYLAERLLPVPEHLDLLDRAHELEDLIRNMFFGSTQVTLALLLDRGDGVALLKVIAYTIEGEDRQYVVACGRRELIEHEARRYMEAAAKRSIRGATLIEQPDPMLTVHFAATRYTLQGADIDDIITLRAYYQQATPDRRTAALEQCLSTLAAWHARHASLQGGAEARAYYQRWLAFYQQPGSVARLSGQAAAICDEVHRGGIGRLSYAAGQLTIGQQPQDVPVGYAIPFADDVQQRVPFDETIGFGQIHGRLTADNILIDSRDGQTWMIDFAQAGAGPLLHDYALLEMSIKCDLLATRTLAERHELERRLLQTTDLTTLTNTEELAPELQQALQIIDLIRRSAAQHAGCSLRTYQAGLFCCALSYLMHYDATLHHLRRDLIPYAHALLSTAMLFDQLTSARPARSPLIPSRELPEQALSGLWVAEDQQVFVKGTLVELTPTELKFLLVLYESAGKLVKRQALMSKVFGTDYEITDSGTIDTNIGRLRTKIGARYIRTQRGLGFVLHINPPSASPQ